MEALVRKELYDARIIDKMIRNKRIQVSKVFRQDRRRQIQADFGLEVGEAAALLIAKEGNNPLGTDDGRAIRAAKIVGVPFFTSIHVLLGLYEKDRMNKKMALVKLEALQKIGRYSPQILADARERIIK